MALAVLRERFDIETSGLHPKHLNRFLGETFDYVITVCDRAAETCPIFPGDPERIQWSFEDPALVGEPTAQRRQFEIVANGLAARLRIWMALPAIQRRLAGAEARDDHLEKQ